MKYVALTLVALLLLSSRSRAASHLSCHANPAMICSVFFKIDDSLSQKNKVALRKAVQDKDLSQVLPGFSWELRNSFDLWGNNDLTRYFKSVGVPHPEIMSDILAIAYAKYLTGQSVDLPAMARATIPPPPPPEPPGWSQGHGRSSGRAARAAKFRR